MQGETDRDTPLRLQARRVRTLARTLARELGDRSAPPDPGVRTPTKARVLRVRRPGTSEDMDLARGYRTPLEEQEAGDPELRADKQTPWNMRAVWRVAVGPAPLGGLIPAQGYLERLLDAYDRHQSADMDDSGLAPLTRSESAYLRRQIAIWSLRAAGLDPRYLAQGTRPGRPRGPRTIHP